MTTHTFHDDILEAGLCDECLRCADLAAYPEELDEPNRARIRAGHLYTELDRVALMSLTQPRRRPA